MKRRNKEQDDVTPEITGNDASFAEVPYGDQGLGEPVGLDFIGPHGTVDDGDPGLRLEADPSQSPDILPDKVELPDGTPPPEATRRWTARPADALRPIAADELPSDDAAAAEDDEDAHERAEAAGRGEVTSETDDSLRAPY